MKMAIVMVVVVVHVAAASLDLGRTGYTSGLTASEVSEVEASAVEAAIAMGDGAFQATSDASYSRYRE